MKFATGQILATQNVLSNNLQKMIWNKDYQQTIVPITSIWTNLQTSDPDRIVAKITSNQDMIILKKKTVCEITYQEQVQLVNNFVLKNKSEIKLIRYNYLHKCLELLSAQFANFTKHWSWTTNCKQTIRNKNCKKLPQNNWLQKTCQERHRSGTAMFKICKKFVWSKNS